MNLKLKKLLVVCATFMAPQILAAPLSLETAPLFTTNSVKPNLILSIDDSGSMDSEVLFPSNDGALWWNTTTNMFVSAGAVNFNTDGAANATWKKFTYLFPNGTGEGDRVYQDAGHAYFAIPPIKQYAFARSSEYNKMYYDPDVTYETWADYTTAFNDIATGSAPSDPTTGATTLDLLTDRYSTSVNDVFKMYIGMKIPTDTYYDNSGTKTLAGADIAITGDIGIEYYPASYYVKETVGSYNAGLGDCAAPSPAHYTAFHAAPSELTDVDSLGPDGSCLTKVEIKLPLNSYTNSGARTDCAIASNCTYAEETQNFANWYSYYRKRHLALRAGMGQAFVGFSAIRTGIFTINDRVDVTMWDMSSASDTFYSTLYGIDGNGGGTPNRHAMDYAGLQFMRTGGGAPIIEECQKNFTLFFTDGFSALAGPAVGNVDGGKGAPYEDAHSNTIADIALKYYQTNLRADLTPTGDVPASLGCSAPTPDAQLDCNTNLHMNTYAVGLGAKGTIFGVTHNTVADAYTTAPAWPNVNSARDPRQVDDLYHAAVNGRGEMFNATSASDLQDKLRSALLGIQASTGVASAVTFNTATLVTNSAVYHAFFNSANWSGDLLSFNLDAFGNVELPAAWSAADVLDSGVPVSHSTRTIITHDGSDGIPFRWDTAVLTAPQQADLNAAPGGDGSKALDFIRGDRSNESSGNYRIRGSILGDTVNAAPVFVGTPRLNWSDVAPFPTTAGQRYSDFRSTLLSTPRTEVIYAGGNDGMLHGFNATTGAEALAYVPNFVYSTGVNKGLHYLTDPLYSHQYYVDLAPTVSDVYIDSGGGDAWHSILIGGGRAGGRGLFALDVTNPATFSEANAADIALWEFTHAELGYTYSKPTIVMTDDGWVAIFGNGYNDTGTGEAKLFIVFLEGGIDGTWASGTDYKIISTKVGNVATPNGLATPAVVDLDGDGTADRAYAGDLQGNMWVFDLNGGFNNWKVAYSTGATPDPLFTAEANQPITQKPVIGFHPDPPSGGSHDPNVLVFFGSGKYIESSDLTTTDQQAFYGVWDDGSKKLTQSDLVEQTFIAGAFADADSNELRLISDNTVNYANKHGWYINLPATGERSVVEPQIRGSLVFFNTWIPSTSPCDSGGTGFLMSVEMLNGGEPDSPAFNIDGTTGVSETDTVTYSGNEHAAAGRKFTNGMPARSSFLGNKRYTPGTDGTLIVVDDVQELEGATGRLSWGQLQ